MIPPSILIPLSLHNRASNLDADTRYWSMRRLINRGFPPRGSAKTASSLCSHSQRRSQSTFVLSHGTDSQQIVNVPLPPPIFPINPYNPYNPCNHPSKRTQKACHNEAEHQIAVVIPNNKLCSACGQPTPSQAQSSSLELPRREGGKPKVIYLCSKPSRKSPTNFLELLVLL